MGTAAARIPTPLTIAGAALLGGWWAVACSPPEPAGPVPDPPPHVGQASAFEDTEALLEAIEEERFAERAGLQEELEAARLPQPLEVAFVRGARVPPDELGRLGELAERVRRDPRIEVDLVGCSDPSGSEAVNLRVSRARAVAVARALRDLGVAEAQIGETEGRGESCEEPARVVRVLPGLRDPRQMSDT